MSTSVTSDPAAVKTSENPGNFDKKDGIAQKRPNTSDVLENQYAKCPRLEITEFGNLPNGVVLTLGMGEMGELGMGSEVMSLEKPMIVEEFGDGRIKKIVAGAQHTICLSCDNEIYSFGCNDTYALGRPTNEDEEAEYLPHLTVGPLSSHKVIHLTAGDCHTMALTDQGKVFLWGVFQLGGGKSGLFSEEVCKVPTIVSSLSEAVVSIASGNDHVVMVSATGKVYTMGRCVEGQLGRVEKGFFEEKFLQHTDNTKSLLRPQEVVLPKLGDESERPKPIAAFAGAFTSWIVTDDDCVYAFGFNNWNQLGFSDNENRYQPEPSPSLSRLKVKQIAGGQLHSVVLDVNGHVFCMGQGEYGCLGLGPDIKQADDVTRIDGLEDVISIAARCSVSYAVDSKGVAYGWGFGSTQSAEEGEGEWIPTAIIGECLEGRKVLNISAGAEHIVLLASLKDAEEAT